MSLAVSFDWVSGRGIPWLVSPPSTLPSLVPAIEPPFRAVSNPLLLVLFSSPGSDALGSVPRHFSPLLAHKPPEEEALALLCPGQAGELWLPVGEDATHLRRPIVLEPTHAAVFEDISAGADGSLWKLSLPGVGGSHDRPRMGKTVEALVDGSYRSWCWGHGHVDDVLELAAFRVGVFEEAEIWNDPEGVRVCTIKVTHVGDDVDFVAQGISVEEASSRAAKALYQRGRLELASWHWAYVRDALPRSLLEEETPEMHLAAQATGNLAACALAMGKNAEALIQARQSLAMRIKPRAVDWIRLGKAARSQGLVKEASTAAKRATECPDLTPSQKIQLATLRLSLREAQATQVRAEKDFCQRALAC